MPLEIGIVNKNDVSSFINTISTPFGVTVAMACVHTSPSFCVDVCHGHVITIIGVMPLGNYGVFQQFRLSKGYLFLPYAVPALIRLEEGCIFMTCSVFCHLVSSITLYFISTLIVLCWIFH